MNTLNKFIDSLSDDVKIQIRLERDVFERDGFIGEGSLRKEARKYMNLIGINSDSNIVYFMNILSSGIDRYFADKYFVSLFLE